MNWAKIGLDALKGALVAAAVDFGAFKKWKSFDDALAYDWRLAAWRWFQGAVIGLVAGFGLGELV